MKYHFTVIVDSIIDVPEYLDEKDNSSTFVKVCKESISHLIFEKAMDYGLDPKNIKVEPKIIPVIKGKLQKISNKSTHNYRRSKIVLHG
jgi:hypothetical protein